MSQINVTTPEILAPAGSIEQLKAAVNNGCDAVYLGLDSFNARMKAPNFNAENIRYWIDYCHLFGVKVYVAINTSIKNNEFVKAVEMLNYVYRNNTDGVILTDVALIKLATKFPKPFDIVASTQLNVHDKYGAEYLKKCGATTVVCARESNLDEIKSVVNTGIKAECFIHGATCVCQSGQCLLSSISGGNSGNRGLCAQPCRKLYSADNGQSYSYLLSARDLCGLDIVQELAEVGVSAFKIEGRNRRAEYAGACSDVYKKLVTDTLDKTYGETRNVLAEMYNREMGELGYLRGKNDDIIYTHSQNHTGVCVGKVKDGGVVCDIALKKGDGLKVFDGDKEICGGLVLESGSGYVACSFSGHTRNGMIVKRTTSVELCAEYSQKQRLIPVKMEFYARVGQPVKIVAMSQSGIRAEISSDFLVQKALNCPTNKSEIAKQLQKTGETYYTICDIVIECDEIFIAKSQINALRRQVLDKLSEAIIDNYDNRFLNRKKCAAIQVDKTVSAQSNVTCAVVCKTIEDVRKVDNRVKYIIFKPQVINEKVLQSVSNMTLFVDLPSFSDNEYLENIFSKYRTGIVCHNVGHVQLARKLGLPYIAGSGLNIYNDYIANEFSDAETFVYSIELTLKEISQFANQSGLIFVDGDITLMKFVHCPFKVVYGCDCDSCKAINNLVYSDTLGNDFRILRRKDGRCTFELVNGRKLSAVSKIAKAGRYLVDYNEKIFAHYSSLNNGINDGYTEQQPYTKGRLFDKVN